MSAPDPRLSDPRLLRLAGLRLQRRKTFVHHTRMFPNPPPAWWDELSGLLLTERHGTAVLEGMGLSEGDVEALQDASEHGGGLA